MIYLSGFSVLKSETLNVKRIALSVAFGILTLVITKFHSIEIKRLTKHLMLGWAFSFSVAGNEV
ncbi:MAG: hypothetical protein ABS938_10345, partial [Psychrobacillus psychrodurans]